MELTKFPQMADPIQETVDLIVKLETIKSVEGDDFKKLLDLYDEYVPPNLELQRLENLRFVDIPQRVRHRQPPKLSLSELEDLGQWM